VNGVVPDVDYGIAEAVRHLVGLGHRSILYAAGPSRSWMSARRWESIRERCDWAHVEVRALDTGAPPTLDGGRSIARQVRASGATAVIAYNDLMAIGLMQELSEAGIRIPDELSIVGFDNIFGSDFTTPPLTTIMSPLYDAGSIALRRLLAEVLGRDDDDASGELLTKLVIRGSTGRASTV
jgi:LacI family transcriptional regulator